jgi:ABC-type branched-subunit amino acid transport system substrate-binding protein
VVAASLLVCENCHGEDGLGRPEGGIQPSDISWASLTKPYIVERPGGRRRPPYTEELLRRAITLGIDSGGGKLDDAMPRYQLTRDDLDDLVAYVKKLGQTQDPGLSDEAVRIGVVLAPGAPSATAARAIRAVLTAFFERINIQGGVFGRRIELCWSESPERPEDRAVRFAAFLESTPVFAVVSPFAAGMESELEELASRRKVPALGPLLPGPRLGATDNRYVFYIDAGSEGQARALVQYAAASVAKGPTAAAILRPDRPRSLRLLEAVRDECRRAGWAGWQEVTFSPEDSDLERVAARLHGLGVAVVLALELDDMAGRMVDVSGAGGWAPKFLLPGAQIGRGLFELHPGFSGDLVVALSSLPTDQTPESAKEFRELSSALEVLPRPGGMSWTALAAARLLVEGLRLSGRNTSRSKFVAALESLHEFRTGYAPPLSFGPRRRVGAWGAYLIDVTPATGRPRSVARWQEVVPP